MKRLTLFSIASFLSLALFSAPTRSRIASAETDYIPQEESQPLPEGLIAVEYIESTGAQWIDTGILVDSQDYTIEISFVSVDTRVMVVYGASNASVGYPGVMIDTVGRYRYGNQQLQATAAGGTVERFDCVLSYRFMSVNGIGYVATGTVVETPTRYSSFVFARNNYGSAGNFSCVQMYSLRIYDGESLLLDFVPVKMVNESDQWEGAMYDRVSGLLFRNSGTGSFIIGPDL